MVETTGTKDEGSRPDGKKGGGWWKLVLALAIVGGGVFAAWKFGLFQMLTMENVDFTRSVPRCQFYPEIELLKGFRSFAARFKGECMIRKRSHGNTKYRLFR